MSRGNKCVYYLCGKNPRHNANLSLFGFPKDLERSRQWIKNSGNTDLIHLEIEDLRKKKICSDHFLADDYLNFSKKILKRSAVPVPYEPVVPFHVRSPKKLYTYPYKSSENMCNLDPSSISNYKSTPLSPSSFKTPVKQKLSFIDNSDSCCLNFESPKSIHLLTPTKTNLTIGSKDNTPILTPKTRSWLDSTLNMPESSSNFEKQIQKLTETTKKQSNYIKKMKERMEFKQKVISNKRSTIAKLKKNLKNSRHLFKNKNIFNSSSFPSTDSQTLVKMQIRQNISRKPWTNLEKDFSLRLYYKSPSAYKFLRSTKINLPGLATIKRWVGASKFRPGFNSNLYQQIKMKVSSMTYEETFCTLIFDEMKIKRFLEYSKVLDTVEGFEDLGTFGRTSAMASQAMVFMIRGIYSSWKLPVSYFLSSTSMKATTLSEIILEQINQLMTCKLHVKAIVCDQGPNNRSALTKLGFTKDKPWIEVNGNKIFSVYDVPHLIKNIRNNFLSSDFIFKNNKVSFQDIKKTYMIDKSSSTSRSLLKITDSHINPGPFKKMSCKLALQIFSKSMFATMRTCIMTQELKSPTAAHTAEFVKEINNLFDCLNSQSLYCSNPYKCAISEERPLIRLQLEEAKRWCSQLKKCKGHGRPYTFDGLEWTINAILGVYEEQKKIGFHYLLTARLNQDAIENSFSVFRQKGGYNNNPTARAFRITFKMMTKMHLMKPSIASNCEADNDHNILEVDSYTNVLENNDNNDDLMDSSSLSFSFDDDESIEIPMVSLSKCSDKYFSGYLGKKCIEKFNCKKCQQFMLTATPINFSDEDYLIFCRAYGSKSGHFGLNVPTDDFTNYISHCQKLLAKIVLKTPHKLQIGLSVKKLIVKKIWPNLDIDSECTSHLEFVTMHLIECKLLRDFNWKSRNMKVQTLSKLKILKNV
ncbi:unnamed protein product [Macrosiphum euphorbiae]|uniref:THAP-type domain-containing protein n=2 Tax=Macrosiphum euphorbiae TaxID=13131 RepID=A0AAV0W5U9_9HEMI|nr:unnamed protein product [Macrosiphum euphorbiae]CAI6360893.1 unnamed protein product [Macrosiphum euphorbiae]